MAEGVTYADLRFAESPPGKSRPPGDTPHDEGSDGEGELTYENFPAASRPRQPAGPGPQPPGAFRGRVRSLVPLALLGACLFLLATCLGLGVRYWQVSRQLEGASRRHLVESGTLAQQLRGQEENLTETLRLLSRAQAELSVTRLALWQSWEAANRSQQQLDGERERLEEERKQWKLAKSGLQQEKAQVVQELEEAKKVLDLERAASCQQMGCCPPGWTLFRWKCLWASSVWKTWEKSREDCGEREARLLVLKPWDAGTFWGAAEVKSLLQSDVFWIGLTRKKEWNWKWRWVDGAPYPGSEELNSAFNNCATLSQGTLAKGSCYHPRRYVCEKVAMPEPALY